MKWLWGSDPSELKAWTHLKGKLPSPREWPAMGEEWYSWMETISISHNLSMSCTCGAVVLPFSPSCKFPQEKWPMRILEELFPELNLQSKWSKWYKGWAAMNFMVTPPLSSTVIKAKHPISQLLVETVRIGDSSWFFSKNCPPLKRA
jgi:hypothetical protein